MYTQTTPQAKDPLQVGEVKIAYWLMQAAGAVAPSSGNERVTDDGGTRLTDDGGTRVVDV